MFNIYFSEKNTNLILKGDEWQTSLRFGLSRLLIAILENDLRRVLYLKADLWFLALLCLPVRWVNYPAARVLVCTSNKDARVSHTKLRSRVNTFFFARISIPTILDTFKHQILEVN